MDTNENRLRELIAIYKRVFGEEITMDEARDIGLRLGELCFQLSKRLPDDPDHLPGS